MNYSLSDITKLLKSKKVPQKDLDPEIIYKLYQFVIKLESKLPFLFEFSARPENKIHIKETAATNYYIIKYDSKNGLSLDKHYMLNRRFNYEGRNQNLAFYIESTCQNIVIGSVSYSLIDIIIDPNNFDKLSEFILLIHTDRVIGNIRKRFESKIHYTPFIIGLEHSTDIHLDNPSSLENYFSTEKASINKIKSKLGKIIAKEIPLEYFRYACKELMDNNKIAPFEQLVVDRLISFGISLYDAKKSSSSDFAKAYPDKIPGLKIINAVTNFYNLYRGL